MIPFVPRFIKFTSHHASKDKDGCMQIKFSLAKECSKCHYVMDKDGIFKLSISGKEDMNQLFRTGHYEYDSSHYLSLVEFARRFDDRRFIISNGFYICPKCESTDHFDYVDPISIGWYRALQQKGYKVFYHYGGYTYRNEEKDGTDYFIATPLLAVIKTDSQNAYKVKRHFESLQQVEENGIIRPVFYGRPRAVNDSDIDIGIFILDKHQLDIIESYIKNDEIWNDDAAKFTNSCDPSGRWYRDVLKLRYQSEQDADNSVIRHNKYMDTFVENLPMYKDLIASK